MNLFWLKCQKFIPWNDVILLPFFIQWVTTGGFSIGEDTALHVKRMNSSEYIVKLVVRKLFPLSRKTGGA